MAASLWWDDSEATAKSDQQNKNDDLLVFGYACKLFRDDEKAKAIDRGKSLIPWMGDESLMIDRYDGRGHLYDLAVHDADNLEDKNPRLSEEEEAIEKACDEERYLELHTDLREAQMYEEEEWKRYYLSLQEGYQAVGFSYEQQAGGQQEQEALSEQVKTEEEKPFVPPEELHIPEGMPAPTCVKQNARIEKTASFIAQHGIQMEIMLKTKQAGNSQFDFLHFENVLNPYYKHVVSMIKSGKYKPQEEEAEEEGKDDNHSHDYLHPSLSSTTQLPPPPPPPSKPIELPKVSIHDTPYGALIKSIRKNTELSTASSASSQAQTNTSSYESGSYSHPVPSYPDIPPPPGTQPVTLPLVSSLNGQAFVDQLYNQPPPPGTEEGDSAPFPSRDRRRKRRASSSDSSSSSSSSSSSRSSRSSRRRSKSPKKRKGSTATARVEGPSPIVPPPPDVQPIIDRMAMYVAKNGAEFEMVVMRRQDPRFQFLNEYHAHYPYYKLKKDRYLEEIEKLRSAEENQDDKSGSNSQRSVSFSIKARPRETQDGSQSSGKLRLFDYDSSDGEEKLGQETPSEIRSGTATPTTRLLGDEDSQKEIEEKLKDKLASAVKERISQTHKEKQLQLERKKKAAMFLNLLKSNQPAGADSTPPPSEDAATLYVGEAAPPPVVFEYDNQSMPHLVSERSRRSRSPKERKRRRRSPTPPSAYSLDRRSPARPSPPRWSGRPGGWSGMRDRTPPWQRRSRDRPVLSSRRSKSRSPHRKDDKKKKHRRSKSRSPVRRDKTKDKSRHSREKSKHKSKEKEKKKKEKSRHRSKERDSSKRPKPVTSSNDKDNGESSNSDVEVLDKSPSDLTRMFTEDHSRMSNGSESGSRSGLDLSCIPIPGAPSLPSSSVESLLQQTKSLTQSESTDELTALASRTTSQGNSPAPYISLSRGSTPSRSSTDTTTAASSDLMSKVRAMLKKSREMILKEEGFSLEDT